MLSKNSTLTIVLVVMVIVLGFAIETKIVGFIVSSAILTVLAALAALLRYLNDM